MDFNNHGYDTSDSREGSGEFNEMAELLKEPAHSLKSVKRGDVVEGVIVRIDPEEILVDIGLKSEGVLSAKELPASGYGSLAELHIGDQVLVYVMHPETPEGHAIVSLRRARMERQWRIAQEQFERGELLEAKVIDHNKGGLIVDLEGLRGFVPISQILNLRREDVADNSETGTKLQGMVGRTLQLKIIEINRNRNRLILSERLAAQEWRARRREELLSELQVGEVRKGIVSNLANFGAFIDLGGADGLVHISQLAWSRVNHPNEVLHVGQEVEVQVLGVDKEKKKIALSIKRAEVDPWSTIAQRYTLGQVVKGVITKIAPFGAFARIEDGVEGLIHLSEVPQGMDPKVALHEGQEVPLRILRIDSERRRLGLSLRAAMEPPEGTTAEEKGGGPTAGAGAAVEAPAEEAPRMPPAERQQPEELPTAMAQALQAALLNRERERNEEEEPRHQ
jgi:small subunit ribosomal protein S1